jgi:hypothetical protein
MATRTWWLRQIVVGGANPNRLYWDRVDAATLGTQATSSTGWNVGTRLPDTYAELNQGTEVGRATFSSTIVPNATAPTVDNSYASQANFTPPTLLSSTDSILTVYEYNGSFDAGNWVFTFPVIAVTLGGAQDGAITMRVFKAPRNGTAFGTTTELTSALLQGTAVSNLTTAAVQSSVVTWSAPAFQLNNEFIICKIGWRITGAGGGNNSDVAFRYGTGCTMVSSNFRKRSYNIS